MKRRPTLTALLHAELEARAGAALGSPKDLGSPSSPPLQHPAPGCWGDSPVNLSLPSWAQAGPACHPLTCLNVASTRLAGNMFLGRQSGIEEFQSLPWQSRPSLTQPTSLCSRTSSSHGPPPALRAPTPTAHSPLNTPRLFRSVLCSHSPCYSMPFPLL